MHAYLATVLRSHDCETLIIGGTSDHMHALFDLSRKHSIATIVKEIKRTSSAWVKDVAPSCKKFHWQNGYGAFSVSQSHLDRVYVTLGVRNNIIGGLLSRMSLQVF